MTMTVQSVRLEQPSSNVEMACREMSRRRVSAEFILSGCCKQAAEGLDAMLDTNGISFEVRP